MSFWMMMTFCYKLFRFRFLDVEVKTSLSLLRGLMNDEF